MITIQVDKIVNHHLQIMQYETTKTYAMIYITAINVIEARLPNKIGRVLRPLAWSLTLSRILLAMLIRPIVITIGILIQTTKLLILPVCMKNANKIIIIPMNKPENSSPKGVQEIGIGPCINSQLPYKRFLLE